VDEKNKKPVRIATYSMALLLMLIMIIVITFIKTAPTAESVRAEKLTKKDQLRLETFLSAYDVKPRVQRKLIRKINSGKTMDSLQDVAKPVKITMDNTAKKQQQVETFADGSIAVTTVTLNDTVTKQNTTSYKNTKVAWNTGIARAEFFADFTINGDGSDDITNVDHYTIESMIGTYQSDTLQLKKKRESLDGKAEATLNFKIVSTSSESKHWVKLVVGEDSFLSTHN